MRVNACQCVSILANSCQLTVNASQQRQVPLLLNQSQVGPELILNDSKPNPNEVPIDLELAEMFLKLNFPVSTASNLAHIIYLLKDSDYA